MLNPWLYKSFYGRMVMPCSAEDRIRKIKVFDIKKLKAVIAWPETQSTVRKAAERRIRKLQRSP